MSSETETKPLKVLHYPEVIYTECPHCGKRIELTLEKDEHIVTCRCGHDILIFKAVGIRDLQSVLIDHEPLAEAKIIWEDKP